ncbi:MAG: hypothetical protein WBM04_08860 [Candidatus Korobacteraceae bacterium]
MKRTKYIPPAPAEEARRIIESCLFDMTDPLASFKRKRRAKQALPHWRAEMARIESVNSDVPPHLAGRK